jgi:hypothetical protein
MARMRRANFYKGDDHALAYRRSTVLQLREGVPLYLQRLHLRGQWAMLVHMRQLLLSRRDSLISACSRRGASALAPGLLQDGC